MNTEEMKLVTLIKSGIIVCFLVSLYYVHYIPKYIKKHWKDSERNRELRSYYLAEKYYYSLKEVKKATTDSKLLDRPDFVDLIKKIKDKIDKEAISSISNKELDAVQKLVEEYEVYVLDSIKENGMIDRFEDLKAAYLKEYSYCVDTIMEKKYTNPSEIAKQGSKCIKDLQEVLKHLELPFFLKKAYKKSLEEIDKKFQEIALSKAKKEKTAHKIIKRIGEIEGYISYLEVFRTLPPVDDSANNIFKTRFFREHLMQNLSEFGKHWSILFGESVGCDLMDLLGSCSEEDSPNVLILRVLRVI